MTCGAGNGCSRGSAASVSTAGYAADAEEGHGQQLVITLLKIRVVSYTKTGRCKMPGERLSTILRRVANDLKKIETLITKTRLSIHTPLSSMLRYPLTGGKRLRPALVMLTGILLKVQRRKLHVLAAAIEVLHSATLIHDDLVDLLPEYQAKGVAVIAINSNDVESYPEDHPEMMAKLAREKGFTFPYLYDETQDVAKAYRAACTPDFFLFDAERKLAYRGQVDDSRPGNNIPVTGADLKAALDALLEGKDVSVEQRPSIGCNIKWKQGNEPEYFK